MNPQEMLGERVVIKNPGIGSTWRGKAIAYSDQPVLLVEVDGGPRMMLPANWAALDEPAGALDERNS